MLNWYILGNCRLKKQQIIKGKSVGRHALHEMIGFNAFSFSCFLCDLVLMLEMVCAEIRIMISQALGDVVLNHRCAQKQVCFSIFWLVVVGI